MKSAGDNATNRSERRIELPLDRQELADVVARAIACHPQSDWHETRMLAENE